MDSVQQMSLFSTLVKVSAAVAILGFVLAVLFFFLFDIRGIYALRTGKAKRETIERMAEQHSKTGRLHKASGRIKDAAGPVVQAPSQIRTADIQTDAFGMTEMVGRPQTYETSVLQTTGMETSVLTAVQQENETSVLSAAVPRESSIRFEITESTLVIHTNEII